MGNICVSKSLLKYNCRWNQWSCYYCLGFCCAN